MLSSLFLQRYPWCHGLVRWLGAADPPSCNLAKQREIMMRVMVMLFAFVLPIGLVAPLGTSDAASNAPTPAPAAAGQPIFVPIDRTHVLLALPPRPSADGAQRQSGAGTFVSPSSGAGGSATMPIYPPPGTTR